MALDGCLYTWLEFKEYYGENWQRRWAIAGVPQQGAAVGPDVPGTPGQQPPQAQPAPSIAGAPQLGAAACPGALGTPGQ